MHGVVRTGTQYRGSPETGETAGKTVGDTTGELAGHSSHGRGLRTRLPARQVEVRGQHDGGQRRLRLQRHDDGRRRGAPAATVATGDLDDDAAGVRVALEHGGLTLVRHPAVTDVGAEAARRLVRGDLVEREPGDERLD
jgi:hypothetical protein